MLTGIIVGCEVAFWVLLLAGLAVRYLLRARRVSTVLLVCVPLVDVVLLAVTAVQLFGGATPQPSHGLAAVYIGFSVAFGHSMMRWADQRFAHRFAGGPPPKKAPKYGAKRARHEWREWGKCVLACFIAAVLLLGGIAIVGDSGDADALWGWLRKLGAVVVIWGIIAASYTVFPKQRPAADD